MRAIDSILVRTAIILSIGIAIMGGFFARKFMVDTYIPGMATLNADSTAQDIVSEKTASQEATVSAISHGKNVQSIKWVDTFSIVFKNFYKWFFQEGTVFYYFITAFAVILFLFWNKRFNKNNDLKEKVEGWLPPKIILPFFFLAFILVSTIYLLIATTIKNNQVDCDSAYPDVCIPSPPPYLDCGDIEYTFFKVLDPDPHWFDVDDNGWGCELKNEN